MLIETPEIMVTDVGRRRVLGFVGELDHATAPELAAAVEVGIAIGAQDIWIDLTETAFMDSAGAHCLLAAEERSTAAGRRLTVICPDGQALWVLGLVGALDRLRLSGSRAEAHLRS